MNPIKQEYSTTLQANPVISPEHQPWIRRRTQALNTKSGTSLKAHSSLATIKTQVRIDINIIEVLLIVIVLTEIVVIVVRRAIVEINTLYPKPYLKRWERS